MVFKRPLAKKVLRGDILRLQYTIYIPYSIARTTLAVRVLLLLKRCHVRIACILPLPVYSGTPVAIDSPRDCETGCQTPLVREPGDQSLNGRCVGEAHAGTANQTVPCIYQRKTVNRRNERAVGANLTL